GCRSGVPELPVALGNVLPLSGQGADAGPGPGLGGMIIDGSTAGDPATFNPLIGSDTASSAVYGLLYPAIIGINPFTGLEEPNVAGAMASGWEYDESGTVLTVYLREDIAWNDGTPITSADYMWSVEATRSGQIDSPRAGIFETMADGTPAGGKIVSIEAPDDYTVVVTFNEADCISFSDVNDVTPVPAHVFSELYGDDYAAMMDEPRRIPTVSFGPFKDVEFSAGERISLLADQAYPDSLLGFISPAESVTLQVADENVATERFIGGEFSILGVPATRQEEFRTDPDLLDYPRYEFTGNGFTFFGMNHANPDNPQPGFDEEGNLVPQEPHPVLGDVLVRQAISHAVDMDALIEGIRDGNGFKVATHTIPTSWVYNPELQYEYNPDLAMEKLTQAGWIDHDDDPDTARICDDCLFAREVSADYNGSPLTLDLHVPAGSDIGEQMGLFFQAEMNKVGFDAIFEAIDWGSAFLPELVGQTFDMNMLGWSLGLPVDPDISAFYYPEVDVPGSGFNFGSYYSAELIELNDQARVVPGCDTETRAALYERVQEILFNDMPYFYMYVSESMTAVLPGTRNWNPTPFSRTYSQDAWVSPAVTTP
ncbi:MAG: ABC transporter substrate-binding protein, partial [Chloroflexi bacterium]|nr:ABC transporter substrate-binding protein [Chloroflexota bacterium]